MYGGINLILSMKFEGLSRLDDIKSTFRDVNIRLKNSLHNFSICIFSVYFQGVRLSSRSSRKLAEKGTSS